MHQCSIAVTKISSVCCTMENEANYPKKGVQSYMIRQFFNCIFRPTEL